MKHRVLLADDHTLVVEGLRKILEPHFELVGAAEDGRMLLEEVKAKRPDVVLMDVSMPLLNGIDAARQLNKIAPDVKIVFVTMHSHARYVRAAFHAGGSGYLLKRSAASELVLAIEEVLKGRYYVTPLVTKDLIGSAVSGEFMEKGGAIEITPELTTRQREVIQLIVEGKAAKEIAAILKISVKTVEYHKFHIMEVLGVRSTAELIKYAVSQGIVPP